MGDAPTLVGARILVVGASAGIGNAFARAALASGASVAVSARRSDRLAEVCKEFTAATAIEADATVPEDCRRLVDEAASALGGLDAVVYAAGSGALALLEKMDAAAWRHDHAVNVLGPMLVAGAALEHLGPDGIVAIVSSEAAVDIRYGLASYASSKAALDQAIAGWRVERPERRFIRITMGSTVPTDFAAGFDPALLGVALERWMARGLSPMDLMEVNDVGLQMAELLAVFLAHPRIDVREFRLSPRGSPNP